LSILVGWVLCKAVRLGRECTNFPDSEGESEGRSELEGEPEGELIGWSEEILPAGGMFYSGFNSKNEN
jgi:hypothetical protein